ncbi:nucleoside diphosphate-linked moiety X motif 19 [Brienomyrus brachyistius]|uniref:nucleoside diphosphate-linked moiety X motif 19 n=1 Tax=Brienomyrus brachyistius TaxID=42636 RepID=UPI0020B41AFE|nr:nucleoside diphosphate-linked moiety X motif 19 [Brienomyrus brachyistius]
MNTALKHWKEAATVILAAGVRRRIPAGDEVLMRAVSPPPLPVGSPPLWPHKSAFDYEVLLLKRSSKSGFMPNAYVFPGGLVDPSDFSADWQGVFQAFRRYPNFGLGVIRQPPETRPPMFATDRSKLGSPIPGEVAFRICAVRETFEEAGVLLAVPMKEEAESAVRTGEQVPPTLTETGQLWDTQELARWRLLVMENPDNFIRMCETLRCMPNIWALHEWGNWLTPGGVYAQQRRYDTAFFICCLPGAPETIQDEKEIVHFKWSTPSEVLHSYQARELWIAPPQFYDLSRMCRFPRLQELHSFAAARGLEGCERWLPVRLVSKDCLVSLLPGDLLYPDDPDSSEQTDIILRKEQRLEELQAEDDALHRIVFRDSHISTVLITIAPKYKHLAPLPGPTFGTTPKPTDPTLTTRSSRL